jgi:hypothetical protein
MVDVYWTCDNVNSLLVEPLKSVVNDLKKNNFLFGEETKNYYKCPGYTNFFKNTFVIESSMSFELTHTINPNGSPNIGVNRDQKFFDDNILVDKLSDIQQMIHINQFHYFFSEQDIEISVMPAFYHDNDLNNHYITSGKFNISKWFRPLYPNIILKGSKLKIEKGDALFYIKFHTNENINFKHFEQTEYLNSLSKDCLNVKSVIPHMGLDKLYKLFTRRNQNKKVLREIKKNLTGDFE